MLSIKENNIMKNTHVEKLGDLLENFELFILPKYDDFLEQERKDDIEYGTGIDYADNLADFYSWLDMQDWDTIKVWVEDYKNECLAVK